MNQTKNKPFFFAAICLLMFAANFANSAQGVLLTDLIDHYGLVSAQQGLMSTVQSAGSMATAVFIVLLAGRMKRPLLLIISACLVAIPACLMSLSPVFPVLLLFYILFGMGHCSASSVSSSLTSGLYPGSAAAMGVTHAVFGLGGLIGPLILKALRNGGVTWNTVMLVVGIAGIVALIIYLISFFHTRTVRAGLPEQRQAVSGKDLCAFFCNKRNILLLIGVFGYSAFQNGVNVWIVRYTAIGLHADVLSAIMLSVFWASMAVARLTVPRIRLSTEVLICAGCFATAGFMAVGVAAGNAVVLLICVVLCGYTSGAAIPQFYHLGCTWNSSQNLLATAAVGIALYLSWTSTAPITAAVAGINLNGAMLLVAAYAVIGGTAMLPLCLRKHARRVK